MKNLNCEICDQEKAPIKVTFSRYIPSDPPVVAWERQFWVCFSCYFRYENFGQRKTQQEKTT